MYPRRTLDAPHSASKPHPPRRLLILLATLLCSAGLYAPWTSASSTLSASQWLRAEAAPQIARTLSQHPKFKGQRVRIGALEAGRPSAASNELLERFRDDLIHQILRVGTNDIAGDDQQCDPHTQVPWYLAIGIETRGRTASVRITLLDTKTGDWVSGISQRWQGRLSADEERAAATISSTTPLGHSSRPLPSIDDPEGERALRALLRCSGLKLTPGSIQRVENEALSRWLRVAEDTITERLPVTFVTDEAEADWLLRGHLSRRGADLDEIALDLIHRESGRTTQLAALYVRTSPESETVQRQVAETVDPEPEPTPTPVTPSITKPVRFAAPELKVEADPACRACAAITLNLSHDAHVLVFSTRHHQVFPLSCERPVSRRHAGDFHFRVRNVENADAPGRPAAGVYALTGPPSVLAAAAKTLVRASARCGAATTTLSAFIDEIKRLPDSVGWDVIHFRRAGHGIRTLKEGI